MTSRPSRPSWWPSRRRPTAASVPPAGLPTPDAIEVTPTAVQVAGTWCRTLSVTGYPREVGLGWLTPLASFPAPLTIALHVDPVPNAVAADRLRRQLARLESSRRITADHDRLDDSRVDAAAEDARDLARRLARAQVRLFRVGLYATVYGHTHAEVDANTQRLRLLLGSMLLDAAPATFRHLHGWITTLPLGLDRLRLRRTFDTDALAAAFPFAAAELPATTGVLYGRTPTRGLVCWDRFTQPNYNAVILARSGAGKSYLAKLELLRSLYQGIEVAVIDPEAEYERLTAAVGGTYLPLGAPGIRVNPFELHPEPDALTRRALFLHTLTAVLLGGDLDPTSKAALDRAVIGAYNARGITADPRTHARPAPILADLAKALTDDGDPAAARLAGRLAPFVSGTHKHLFDGPTTTRPEGHLVVFSLRELPDELASAGTLLILDALWRRITDPAQRRRRLVVVDEAWLLLRDPAGGRFLMRLAKAARKHWTGLTVVTQDAADLLGSDLGQAVAANAATQILLAQAPQAADQLARAFNLSDGERAFLLAAQTGEGILAAPGGQRLAFKAQASPAEHALVTTDPEFLASLERADELSRGELP